MKRPCKYSFTDTGLLPFQAGVCMQKRGRLSAARSIATGTVCWRLPPRPVVLNISVINVKNHCGIISIPVGIL
jgi:hypothetical protein